MALAIALHVLAVIFWVGGMSFAYFCLRPSVGPLEPPVRLALWNRVFARFLPAVGGAIVVILASGLYMMLGLGVSGPHVQAMAGLGIVMMLLFGHMWGAVYRRFSRAVAAGDIPGAAARLNQIRLIVMVNLALGTLVAVIGASGRYWG